MTKAHGDRPATVQVEGVEHKSDVSGLSQVVQSALGHGYNNDHASAIAGSLLQAQTTIDTHFGDMEINGHVFTNSHGPLIMDLSHALNFDGKGSKPAAGAGDMEINGHVFTNSHGPLIMEMSPAFNFDKKASKPGAGTGSETSPESKLPPGR